MSILSVVSAPNVCQFRQFCSNKVVVVIISPESRETREIHRTTRTLRERERERGKERDATRNQSYQSTRVSTQSAEPILAASCDFPTCSETVGNRMSGSLICPKQQQRGRAFHRESITGGEATGRPRSLREICDRLEKTEKLSSSARST